MRGRLQFHFIGYCVIETVVHIAVEEWAGIHWFKKTGGVWSSFCRIGIFWPEL